MHITNRIFYIYIFTVGNLQNIFMKYYLYFNILMIVCLKEKSIILPYTMAIATNIPMLLMIGFVVQDHIRT